MQPAGGRSIRKYVYVSEKFVLFSGLLLVAYILPIRIIQLMRKELASERDNRSDLRGLCFERDMRYLLRHSIAVTVVDYI